MDLALTHRPRRSLRERALGVPADDGIIDHDDPAVGDGVPERLSFDLMPRSLMVWLGWMKVRPTLEF